ncbi:hypothetical protein [Luteimonas sp. FCS-9]|uniref:hypothetical protein n=1 Tax=Luteimonas sp. FCS-9 TaxID=1547516 RepID=UPI0012E0372C|nr:hypothetical protein [Luteimonas sp. FCS-9]
MQPNNSFKPIRFAARLNKALALMKPIAAAALSALSFGTIGWFAGLSVGFAGPISFLALGAAGSFFGLLLFTFGAKALWLPAGGLMVGIALVLAAQLMIPAKFEAFYYLYVPILASVVITPSVSIVLHLFPALRDRVFGNPRTAIDGEI